MPIRVPASSCSAFCTSAFNIVARVRTSSKHWEVSLLSDTRFLLRSSLLRSRSFIRLVSFAIRLKDKLFIEQLHGLILRCGFFSDVFVGSALVSARSKCCSVEAARNLFDEMPLKDLELWNVMVSCYASRGLTLEAFRVFGSMRSLGFRGDGFTLSSLLNACSSSGCCCYYIGRQTHCLVVRSGVAYDLVVGSALVNMYVKSDYVEDARQAFDEMRVRNSICWNTLIVGYGKVGDVKVAFKLLKDMLQCGTRPDDCTFPSVLSTCANMAAWNEIIQIHGYLVKNGFESFTSTGNALIIAYAKSGCIRNATRVFQSIHEPDLVSWSSMIFSLAFHGHATEAVHCFQTMLNQGIAPDGVAFLGVLSACSHAGLVEAGCHCFSSMIQDYQLKPSSKHLTCLIDLLARAGHLEQAYNLIVNIPFEHDEDVLGALLGACKVHKNTRLAKWAANILFSIEPKKPVNYVLLSNIYVAVDCWEEVGKMRRMMRDRSGKKVPGCSWTELHGSVQTFVSDDRSHVQALELHAMLESLIRLMGKENDNFVVLLDEIIQDSCNFG